MTRRLDLAAALAPCCSMVYDEGQDTGLPCVCRSSCGYAPRGGLAGRRLHARDKACSARMIGISLPSAPCMEPCLTNTMRLHKASITVLDWLDISLATIT